MNADDIDITDSFTWEDGLPHPQWDLIEAWVNSRYDLENQRDAWIAIGRQWFLRDAGVTDCGESACVDHLGFGLHDLAARFLGPGAWSPDL